MKFQYAAHRLLFCLMIVLSTILQASETVCALPQPSLENIENFLNRTVPGLKVSYNEVIDAMVQEGWEVYIRGGAIRDLLASAPKDPNDIDLDYSGTVEELKNVLEQNQWQYTHLPGKSTLIIGDHQGVHLEAVPLSVAFGHGESTLEFTINNIFYHCNKKSLSPGSEIGLEDLYYKRLRILNPHWKAWLYRKGPHPFERIFRSWNMIGKGFIYSVDFANFLNREAVKKIREFPDIFREEMLDYVSKHFESFDDVYHGAVAIMGYHWARENLFALKGEAEKKNREKKNLRDQFTHYFSDLLRRCSSLQYRNPDQFFASSESISS